MFGVKVDIAKVTKSLLVLLVFQRAGNTEQWSRGFIFRRRFLSFPWYKLKTIESRVCIIVSVRFCCVQDYRSV
jgi:hypothetical protein